LRDDWTIRHRPNSWRNYNRGCATFGSLTNESWESRPA